MMQHRLVRSVRPNATACPSGSRQNYELHRNVSVGRVDSSAIPHHLVIVNSPRQDLPLGKALPESAHALVVTKAYLHELAGRVQ